MSGLSFPPDSPKASSRDAEVAIIGPSMEGKWSDFSEIEIDPADLVNGFAASEIFGPRDCTGITFDDLIVLPGSIDFGVGDVVLETKVTKNFTLKAPLCSSPMDTVTEHEIAIGMALNGGVGFIHGYCTILAQVEMVKKVKNYENGFILEPVVMSPTDTLATLDNVRAERGISGVPVTEDGKIGSKLIGLVSNRDSDFLSDRSVPLSAVMTALDKLVVGQYGISIVDANKLLKEKKKGYLPIVDSNGNLCGLTTRTDLQKNSAFPESSKDAFGKLLVGAAIRSNSDDDADVARVDALCAAGCNIIVLDAQNGHNGVQLQLLKYIKETYPAVDVIGGNVVRASQACALLEAGADGLRIGMGTGSIGTTQLVKAVGRGQLSSIYACSKLAKEYGVPVIADGGIKNTGCLIKALTCGAGCVMMGSLLAGVDESPGDYFFHNGMRLKNYRGMFSSQAHARPSRRDCGNSMNAPYGSSDNNSLTSISSGVSGAVVDKGPLNRYFPYLCQSIKHGLQDMGIKSIKDLGIKMGDGTLRFELRSPSAQKEGGVHDLHSFQQRLYS